MPKSKTKDNKLNNTTVCVLCRSGEDDELHFGKFYHSKDLSVHNFCMLFASDLSQNGKNDDDGFAGFLPKDIKKEVVRGRRLKCSYCKMNGATIGCCVPACKKVFHLNCGQKRNSLHLFFDSFLSYCSAHKAKPIYPEGEPLTKEFICSICCETVCLKNYDTTVWTSCCKNGWFHKPCIQRQAHNAGYFFRCPLCNNTEQFQKQMLHHGIYIPQQDAAWELEENAFQELLIRHEQCDASRCLCPKGRKYHTKTSQWRLVLCEDCGSEGRHIGCDDSVSPKGTWKCQPCLEITAKIKAKENECLNNKVKKTKTSSKPQTSQESSNGRALRSSVRNTSAENTSSFKDEIHQNCEELPSIKDEILSLSEEKADEASCTSLHGGATSLTAESTYKITKISNRGEEDLSKFAGNSGPFGIKSETDELLAISDYTETSNLEQDNVIDLFSDVVGSVPENELDSSPYKSEIFSEDNADESDELPCGSLCSISLKDCKVVDNFSIANSSASHLLLDNRSVSLESEVSKMSSVKNEFYLLPAGSSSETEDSNVTSAASKIVDCEIFLSPNTTPVDVSCKENTEKEELEEMSTVEGNLANFSFSPDTLKNTYKMHRKDSKRICTDMEDKLPKKQRVNSSSGQSCSSVTILNLEGMRRNPYIEHKYTVNSSYKTVNDIISPAMSSSPEICYNQNIGIEEQSSEAFNTENILGNSSMPVVMKINGNLGYNSEKDHREPLVKLITVHNRLAKKTVRTGRREGNCEISRDGAQCSNNHRTSEHSSVKKQKLNVLSKKNYGTALRCKDNYRCIKALLGGPCRCCEDRPKLTKEASTKSKSSKKCSQNCKPQYNIECIGKRSEEMSIGSKHSCNRPTNYIVNFWQPARQISTISETKEKLSVKPQVIHLKTASH